MNNADTAHPYFLKDLRFFIRNPLTLSSGIVVVDRTVKLLSTSRFAGTPPIFHISPRAIMSDVRVGIRSQIGGDGVPRSELRVRDFLANLRVRQPIQSLTATTSRCNRLSVFQEAISSGLAVHSCPYLPHKPACTHARWRAPHDRCRRRRDFPGLRRICAPTNRERQSRHR